MPLMPLGLKRFCHIPKYETYQGYLLDFGVYKIGIVKIVSNHPLFNLEKFQKMYEYVSKFTNLV